MNTNIDGALSRKRMTPQEEKRYSWCLAAISVLKGGGISLAELDEERHNERASKAGLEPVQLPKALSDVEKRAQTFAGFVRGEKRSMGVGNLGAQLGTYTGLGFFVPTNFHDVLYRSLKAHDCLFDEDTVTLLKANNGRLLPIPTGSNTEHSAVVTTEAGSRTPVDINSLSHVVLSSYSYSTDQYYVSIEALQDLSNATGQRVHRPQNSVVDEL